MFGEGPASLELDYVQMYKLVVNFKENLSKLFSEKGLMVESSRLDDLKTVSVERQADGSASVQQLSSNVLLVFQLVVELIHAAIVSKNGTPGGVQRAEKAAQTEEMPPIELVVTTDSTPVKEEKEEENSDDSDPVPVPVVNNPAPKISCVPLRKSLRTSVLNRKPFVTPKRQTQRNVKPPDKPSSRPAGAKKRKLGTVNRKTPSPRGNKKVVKEKVDPETDVEKEKPRRVRRSGLATNMYERTAEGKFRCKECGKVAKLQTNIRKHLRKHTGEKPYKCAKCPVAFAYPRSLKRHELVHEGIRPFKCPECDKCFFDPTSLRTHSRVHTNDRPYVCQICGDRFRQNEGLKGHMRRHTGDRPYVCEHCGMAFAAKRSLTRHIRVHTGERPYSCDQCVAAFADWTTLHNHKLVHRSPGAGDGPGEGQEKDGQDKDSAASDNRPFQCQFCGIRYRQPLSLKRHLRLHSGNPAPKKPNVKKTPRRRAEEGEVFKDEETMALHLHYRPYECELCGEKFKHLRGYDTHKNKHQSGTLVAKKTPAKRIKQDEVPELSHHDIEQAATILASVAVNNSTAVSHSTSNPDSTAVPLSISIPHDTTAVPHNITIPHSASVPQTITIPHTASVPQTIAIPHCAADPHSLTMPPNAGDPHTHSGSGIAMSLLPPPPQPDNSTVTIIDAATFSSIASATEPSSMHLPVSSTPMVTDTADMIQYTSGNVTQVIQYPDGTLSEVTTLVPHPPPPSIIPSTELLDNVVTVVFETRDGSVVLENQ